MNEQTSNTIWVRAYTPDGFQLSLTLSVQSVDEAVATVAKVRAAGFLPAQPESVDGEREAIASVMRHATSTGTPVIAAYPNWRYEGKFGEYKFASIYLDSPENIAQFEAQSGLKVNEIPLSDGDAGVRRKYGKPNPKEVAVKRSFDMLKIPDGTTDDGKSRYRYTYAVTLPVAAAPAAGWSQTDVQGFIACWEKDELTVDDLKKALNIKAAWSEWKGSRAAADAAVTAYIQANLATEPATTRTGATRVSSH